MPVIGEFHDKYWRARAGAPAPPTYTGDASQYPAWQTSVTMHCSLVGGLIEAVTVLWARLQWLWRVARRLRLNSLTSEQLAVLDQAIALMQGPPWATAQGLVQQVATSPGFHRPEQWVEYSRAIKANPGQAQNVFRHVKVVHALTASHPELTNPEVHLLAEMGYHAFARIDRRERQIVTHPSRIVEHVKVHVAR